MRVIKNYIYNALYQFFSLLVPLVTIPYISRVLGPKGVGINTLTSSTVQYFVLAATLGLTFYGQREVAYRRHNQQQLSVGFWEIELLSMITTSVACVGFFIFLLVISRYRLFYLAQAILIISSAFDVSWLFMGLEKFEITVLRNFVVKLVALVLIFTMVKNQDDLLKYIIIVAGTTLAGNLSLWPYITTYVRKVPLKLLRPLKHLRPTMALFIPQVAISLYTILNKVMLGHISTVEAAGYFDNSDKIIRMALTIITAFTAVMMPHAANAFMNGEKKKVRDMLNNGLSFAIIVSIPLFFLIASVSNLFVPWFFGHSFIAVIGVMKIEAFAIIPIGVAGIIGAQFLVPSNRTKEYTISILVGTLVNILINVPLLSLYGANGAAIATVVSEFFVTGIQFVFVRREIYFKDMFITLIKTVLASTIMVFCVRVLLGLLNVSFLSFFFAGVAGIVIYVVVLKLLKLKQLNELFKTLLRRNVS